ncbi:MAG: hypothetical protein GY937_28280 [bacterium]|nr:hypothetical protein [bacterium]
MGDLELPEALGHAGLYHSDLLLAQARAPADPSRGLGAQQDGARAPRHFRRVLRVVVVGVHRHHRRQARDAGALQAAGDGVRVRGYLALQQEIGQAHAGEPAVGHQVGLAVADEQGGHAQEAHGDPRRAGTDCGGRQLVLRVAREIRPILQPPRDPAGPDQHQHDCDAEAAK